MRDYYDIAVIGESMSGKSTFIASLYKEDITTKLRKFTEENNEGQTKIPVHYSFLDPSQPLQLSSINWNMLELVNYLKKEQVAKTETNELMEILNTFKFPNYEPSDNEDKDIDSLKNILEKYLNSLEYNDLISKMDFTTYMELINNQALDESHIISSIELSGGARENIWEAITERGQKKLKLRDTRGFLDESPAQWHHHLEQLQAQKNFKGAEIDLQTLKLESASKLLDERGLQTDLDACIFMSTSNSTALSKKLNKDMYGSMLTLLFKSCPIALIIRENHLTDIMCSSGIDYDSAVKQIKTKYYTGFNSLRNLIEAIKQNEETTYISNIVDNNYREYIIADVNLELDADSLKQAQEVYYKSTANVMTKTLDIADSFRKDLNEAEACLKQILGEHSDYIIECCDKLFEESIRVYNNHYDTLYLIKENIVDTIKVIQELPYKGGLVGVREGLSTWIDGYGRNGKYAIAILEGAYKLREDLFKKLLAHLKQPVRAFLQTQQQTPVSEESVKDMMAKIERKYTNKLNENFERLSFTERMIPRSYLENVYKRVKKELDVQPKYIHSYLTSLQEKPKNIAGDNNLWLKDRHLLSVIKLMVFYLANLDDNKTFTLSITEKK
jgi:hypothetical protein